MASPYEGRSPAGGKPRKQRQPKPSMLDKQATVFAAEQNLKPWEAQPPKGKPAKVQPAPVNARYRAAVAAPVNAPIKVGKTKVPAREFLARTETPVRRAQYQQIIKPPAPKVDTSFLHALLSTPASIGHSLGIGAHGASVAAGQLRRYSVPKQLGGGADLRSPPGQRGPLGGLLPTGKQFADINKSLVGPALYNAVTKGQTGHLAAAGLEAAALLPPIKAARIAEAIGKASEAVRAGREGLPAYHAVVPARSEITVRVAKGSQALQVPERTAVHKAIDTLITDKPLATKVKDQVDATAHLHTFGLPHEQQHLAASKEYQGILDALPKAQGGEKVLMKGMGEASRLRREQEALRSIERAQRGEAVAKALQTPGHEGYVAARAALKGPLPTLHWDRFTNFDQPLVDAMVARIRTHPSLEGLPYAKLNTEAALHSVLAGNLPRKFEQKLLANVFGEHATGELIASVSRLDKAKAAGLNLIGVPRTLLASFDLSAPLRQALTLGTSHPVIWGKNFPTMLKAAVSPTFYDDVMRQITERPTFDLMQQAKVPFTDIGTGIAGREEERMSSYAERIYGIGRFVRGSNRAYTAFLNKARADYFDWLLERAAVVRPDVDIESPAGQRMLHDFARVVGNATGRGQFKNDTIVKALPALNQLFFAPRLLKSRLDVIANPIMYARLDPVARREAFKQLAGLVGTVAGVLTIAKLAGARVGTNPTSADWAKVRVGNTRFDIAGGFQQPLRLMAQLQAGKITSSTTGKSLTLGAAGGYGHLTKLDILQRFAESKLAPPPAVVVDFFRGTQYSGKPFSWKSEAYQRLTPLMAQDAIDLYQQGDNTAGNIAAATALYGIGMWGVGTQTYGPKPKGTALPKARSYSSTGSAYSRTNSSGGSPYEGRTP